MVMEDEGLNIKGFTGIEGYSSGCLLRFFGGVPPSPLGEQGAVRGPTVRTVKKNEGGGLGIGASESQLQPWKLGCIDSY